MKLLLTSVLTVALALLVLIALPASGEETVYTDTLRLHVLAASDTTADQEAKLAVRDAILSTYGEALSACESRAEAVALAEKSKAGIEEVAREALLARGIDAAVTVDLAEEWFDTRTYVDFTLPQGTYTALRVTLGEGRGQNFFCMLYPALCITPALGETVERGSAAYSEETFFMITEDGYGVRFRALEVLSALFA